MLQYSIASNKHDVDLSNRSGLLVQILETSEHDMLHSVFDAAVDVDISSSILDDMSMLWLEAIRPSIENVHSVSASEVWGRSRDVLGTDWWGAHIYNTNIFKLIFIIDFVENNKI